MRILGINIPNDKRLDIGLTTLFGIGTATATKILKGVGVDPAAKPTVLSIDQENEI